MNFSPKTLKAETQRLMDKLSKVGWSESDCRLIAPLTLEINLLKKEKRAIILAHSYLTPDLMYGVADFVGDSYGLSREAQKTDAKKSIMNGRKVYIVDGARTPFLKTRSEPGLFSASDLAVACARPVLARQPFPASLLDEVIVGCVIPAADEANIARLIAGQESRIGS